MKSARTFLSCPAASKACSLPEAETSTKSQDLANFVSSLDFRVQNVGLLLWARWRGKGKPTLHALFTIKNPLSASIVNMCINFTCNVYCRNGVLRMQKLISTLQEPRYQRSKVPSFRPVCCFVFLLTDRSSTFLVSDFNFFYFFSNFSPLV